MNSLDRLVHVSLAAGVVATVPDLHKWVLRWVKVINDTAGPVIFKLGIGGTGAGKDITNTITLAAGESYREYMHVTMERLETLNAAVTGAGATLIINGIDQS